MSNYRVPVCLYHKNCLDGIAAAWVVWTYFEGDVELIPIQYGDPIPDNLDSRDVYVVDFSFPAEETRELMRICNLVVLDHHESAARQLERLNKMLATAGEKMTATIIIDQTHSGALVTWNHFFTHHNPPEKLLLVQDRDLWQFKHGDTRPWTSAMFSYSYTDIETFDALMRRPVLELVAEGNALQRKQEQDVNKLAKTSRLITIDDVTLPVVNANSHYSSDLGHLLGDGHLGAVTYVDGKDGRIFSLRSRKDTGMAVNLLAERFGGGGHPNAAGFKIAFSDRRFKNSHVKLRSKGYYWRKLKSLVGFN